MDQNFNQFIKSGNVYFLFRNNKLQAFNARVFRY